MSMNISNHRKRVSAFCCCTPLDELIDQGQALGHSGDPVAEPIRAYQQFDRVDVAGEVIRKTGKKTHF